MYALLPCDEAPTLGFLGTLSNTIVHLLFPDVCSFCSWSTWESWLQNSAQWQFLFEHGTCEMIQEHGSTFGAGGTILVKSVITTKKVWTVGRLSSIHVQYWIDTSTIKVEQNSLTQTYSTAHRIHHIHWCHFPLSPPHTTDIFYKPNKCSWLIKHTFPFIRQY